MPKLNTVAIITEENLFCINANILLFFTYYRFKDLYVLFYRLVSF
jgi:hypothetical protein